MSRSRLACRWGFSFSVQRAAEEGFYPPQPEPGPDGAAESWLWVVHMAIERGGELAGGGGGGDEQNYPVW
jgi:hypothetical protein